MASRSLRIEVPYRVKSWNKYYEQKHWAQRHRDANLVHALVREQLDPNMSSMTPPVHVRFIALYRTKPVDIDNLTVKLYVDGLMPLVLEDDGYTYIPDISLHVRKGERDTAVLVIEEIGEAADLSEWIGDEWWR